MSSRLSASRVSGSGGAAEVTFWGTRGSIAAPGPETVVFGGNTSCLEIDGTGSAGGGSILVDAGTGIRAFGNSRSWQSGDVVHLLLTHLHHDHVIGLPFFRAIFVKGLTLHIWCGNLGGDTAEACFDRLFAPPLFPFTLGDAPAKIVFHGFQAGETIRVAGRTVRTHLLRHPSGATGYRFGDGSADLAVITDIEHEVDGPDAGLVAFCRGAGTIIYDTMLCETEYGGCKGWGHSTISAAVALMRAAGAGQLVGFHHGPGQDDAALAMREAEMQTLWPHSQMAREGQTAFFGPAVGPGVAKRTPEAAPLVGQSAKPDHGGPRSAGDPARSPPAGMASSGTRTRP